MRSPSVSSPSLPALFLGFLAFVAGAAEGLVMTTMKVNTWTYDFLLTLLYPTSSHTPSVIPKLSHLAVFQLSPTPELDPYVLYYVV